MTAPECAGCPMPDQVAALELVRLREGIGRLAEEWMSDADEHLSAWGQPLYGAVAHLAEMLRALLDDNQEDS